MNWGPMMMDMEQIKQQIGQMNMDQAMNANGMGLQMLGIGHPQGRARQGQPPNVSALSCVVGTCALCCKWRDARSGCIGA